MLFLDFESRHFSTIFLQENSLFDFFICHHSLTTRACEHINTAPELADSVLAAEGVRDTPGLVS